jgi:hypothetical protein
MLVYRRFACIYFRKARPEVVASPAGPVDRKWPALWPA